MATSSCALEVSSSPGKARVHETSDGEPPLTSGHPCFPRDPVVPNLSFATTGSGLNLFHLRLDPGGGRSSPKPVLPRVPRTFHARASPSGFTESVKLFRSHCKQILRADRTDRRPVGTEPRVAGASRCGCGSLSSRWAGSWTELWFGTPSVVVVVG